MIWKKGKVLTLSDTPPLIAP